MMSSELLQPVSVSVFSSANLEPYYVYSGFLMKFKDLSVFEQVFSTSYLGVCMVLVIVLLLLALMQLNPNAFVINREGKSKLKNMYEILKIYNARFYFSKIKGNYEFYFFLSYLEKETLLPFF